MKYNYKKALLNLTFLHKLYGSCFILLLLIQFYSKMHWVIIYGKVNFTLSFSQVDHLSR